jgi:C-7 ketoreductase
MTGGVSDGTAVMPPCQTAIVTGGGAGIGRATARLFAKEGGNVLIVGRTAEHLAETAEDRPNIRTLVADVTDPDAPAAIVAATLEAFGRIDVLVNNAGISRPARLGEIDRERAAEQLATNLVAPIFLAQEVVPHLRPGGVIVNVSSNPPERGWPTHSIYGSTKVSIDFLTRTWAMELAPRGIRVVSVAPGVTETSWFLHANISAEELAEKRRNRRIPLGREAQPEEIAWWIVTATRPEASYVTGAVFRVDGGISIC